MVLSTSFNWRRVGGGLRVAMCLFLLTLALPVGAVVPESKRLVPKDEHSFINAGFSGRLAMGAGIVAAGSPFIRDPKTGLYSGGVLLWDAATGRELPTLYPPVQNAQEDMGFGGVVAMSGSTLVIGASSMDSTLGADDDTGGAFIYDVKARRYLTAQPLRAAWAQASDRYGMRVAVDGDLVAVGAPYSMGQGSKAAAQSGTVLVVNFRTGDYSRISPDEVGLLGLPVETNTVITFGTGLALRGRTLAAGAPNAIVSGNPAIGRVYLISVNLGAKGGPGGTSAVMAEVAEPGTVPATFGIDFGEVLALGSHFLVTGTPDWEFSNGRVAVFDTRELPHVPLLVTHDGSLSYEKSGLAVATEGNRYYFSDGLGRVVGHMTNSPFIRKQAFPIWDTDKDSYGSGLAAADGRLAVGQPTFRGRSLISGAGSVVLHPTKMLHGPGFSPGPLTGDAAPSMPGSSVLAKFLEVTLTLRPPALYPAGNPALFPAGNPLFIGKLEGGVAGVKGPMGVFEHYSNLSMSRAMGQSTMELPLLSRPIANHSSEVWLRAAPRSGGVPNILTVTPAKKVLHNGEGELLGLNLPLKSVGELRVDDVSASRGIVPVRLRLGGAVDAGNDSAMVHIQAESPFSNDFFPREGDFAFPFVAGAWWGEVAPRGFYTFNLRSYMTGLTGDGVTPETNQMVQSGHLKARRGDAPAQPPQAVFRHFTGEVHSRMGFGLIRAVVSGPGVTSATNEGLWSNRSGGVSLILQKGVQAPALPTGVKVKRLLNYAIVGDSDILILAQVAGPGVNSKNDGVLYVTKTGVPAPGQFELLVREGERLQAMGGAKVGTILRLEVTMGPLFSDRSRYGVLCSLVNEPGRVTPKDNLVWVVGSTDLGTLTQSAARLPLPKLRKGEFCEVFGPGYDRVNSLSFPATTRDATGALMTGMAQVLDHRHGGSVGVVTFPNKRQTAALIW